MAQNQSEIRYLTPPTVEIKKKKYCRFKKNRIKYIDYKDPEFLKKFLNEQGKILPRRLTGTSLKYQRKVSTAIKRARFIALLPSVLGPLSAYLRQQYGHCTGISFIDSTTLSVCDNHRIHCHRAFEGLAERGKSSMGWFYGFKLHFVVNDCGELLACRLTSGNVDDRTPVPILCSRLYGKLIGDKDYLSQPLFEQLMETFGLQLITKIKSNMKNRLMNLIDKLLLRKRSIVETVIDQLKNISQIEHTLHRSPVNFLVNVIAGLIAYCHQPKKPSLNINRFQPALIAYP